MAKIATPTKKTRMTSPTIPIRSRRKACQKRWSALRRLAQRIRRGLPGGTGCGISSSWRGGVCIDSGLSNPWIQVGVGEVGNQVEDDHREREEQEQPLQNPVVLRQDRGVREQPEPLVREDDLDGDRTTDDVAERQG